MPTENRSSNTEMVSVPTYIGLEPLVGRYYPAQCRRCSWVGSSEELTEDDAQCTRDIGDRLCLGDCDELERHDLLNIIQAMAAPQPHPEPIAWMVGTAIWWTKEEAERDAAAIGLPIVGLGPMTASIPAEQSQGIPVGEVVAFGKGLHEIAWAAGRMPKLGAKLYTNADPGEVERLRAQLAELVSAVRSINFGPAHAIQMRGDDEPCYPQRKEWIEWLLELCEAASVEPSASAGSDPWLPLTALGQIQVGDWLSFTVAGSFICAKARLIIAPGTTNEEIVYNLKKNHYFCTDMAIDGTSNHKGVLVAKAKP
ncbi:hypothetical protein [Pseudomonas sp.]|uniref:hypothetical protein n=1 Tax=Pseudomonas sp. TaxID=306 RepID=UPI0028AA1794|nr:hypothetical protein [Pseudomonas sp.]